MHDRVSQSACKPHRATSLEPGARVRHPHQPGWGVGQVQSVIGDRVTVNFEHAGKILINTAVVILDHADD